MKNEKLYLIDEEIYHKHIDGAVHLYGLLHQLAFMAGKVKEVDDLIHLQDTAIRYGEMADELFEGWNIPGRYLVYGDKADLETLKAKELSEVVFDPEDEADDGGDGECTCLRCALEEYLNQLEGMADIIAEALEELDALGGEQGLWRS